MPSPALYTKSASEILYAARDIIQTEGWTDGQDGMLVGNGPKCIEGALGKALGVPQCRIGLGWVIYAYDKVEESDAYLALAEHLNIGSSLYAWNDKQTDELPIIEALTAAAVIAEAREDANLPVSW